MICEVDIVRFKEGCGGFVGNGLNTVSTHWELARNLIFKASLGNCPLDIFEHDLRHWSIIWSLIVSDSS